MTARTQRITRSAREAPASPDAATFGAASPAALIAGTAGRLPHLVALERMMDMAMRAQAEAARFAARRAHAAMEAHREMLGCRSPGELHAARSAYLGGMARDYATEWLRLWEMGLRTGTGGARGAASGSVPDPFARHATPV
jgi:hypothetical protein